MTEADPPGSQVSRSESADIAFFPASRRPDPPAIAFDRHELRQIMNLYGRMVSHGEWRDYAIDFLRDRAVFSIFRRSSEMPLYRIVKDPALAQRQGAYSVLAPTGMILKRGHDLARVLQVIDKPIRVVV
jgi:hypothetical protein